MINRSLASSSQRSTASRRSGTAAVASALNQTYSNIEIVISDNASTDGSLDAIGEFTSDPLFKSCGAIRTWVPLPTGRPP